MSIGLFFHIYSMVRSPSWEANWFATSQEIPRISRNPKVHYHTHKRPPPVSILGQPNPVHIHTSHLLEIVLILSAHLRLGLPSGLLPSGFLTKTLYIPLSSPIRATCTTHLILLDFITRTIFGEEYISFSSALCNLLHSPVTSSLLGPNILLNTLFSNTLSFLCYFSIPPVIWTNVEHRWMINLQGNVEIPVPVPFAYHKFQWTAMRLKPYLHIMRSADRNLNHGLSLCTGFKDFTL